MKYLRQHRIAIRYLNQHLSRNQFLILSGILVGLSAGTAAVFLKSAVHYINLLTETQLEIFSYPYLNLFLPLIGILLTVWVVKRFLKGKDGKGIANILQDISQRSGVVPKYKIYSQVITSALTVGFGGSAGLESPIAVTGAAIGSNYARTYRMTYRERILLLACGVASGIAAAFNAPITGLMFAFEVILVGVVFSDFIPLIISTVSATLLSKIILNDDILFEFKSLREFDYINVPLYISLGIFSGLVSVYYSRITKKIDFFFHDYLQWNAYYKAIFGGLIIALLCFLFPPLFGEGYQSIKYLASNTPQEILKGTFFNFSGYNQWTIILFSGLIILTKVLATSITLASGGSGGNFAPSLFTGAFMGFFFSSAINLLGFRQIPVDNFTLVGMCGILSGVMYAPLTGIFLIAEITGGYDLIIPLMIVATSSYIIAKFYEPHSMDVKELIKGKKIFTENYDDNIISLIKIHEIITKDYVSVTEDSTLAQLSELFKNSDHNIIVINDHHGQYKGFIVFDKVRKLLLDHNLQQDHITAQELIQKDIEKLDSNASINQIIDIFDKTDIRLIPIFEDGVFEGFVSKNLLLTAYRIKLKLTLN
ncbi:chloride channel protein [Pseudopedobacter beijingensis]|uniref:Chloride channel protein n=1 Tax=Pseudopedobacter beijingensis TaxID=1207056 RepID=A0ABW4IDN4_9SPHI